MTDAPPSDETGEYGRDVLRLSRQLNHLQDQRGRAYEGLVAALTVLADPVGASPEALAGAREAEPELQRAVDELGLRVDECGNVLARCEQRSRALRRGREAALGDLALAETAYSRTGNGLFVWWAVKLIHKAGEVVYPAWVRAYLAEAAGALDGLRCDRTVAAPAALSRVLGLLRLTNGKRNGFRDARAYEDRLVQGADFQWRKGYLKADAAAAAQAHARSVTPRTVYNWQRRVASQPRGNKPRK